MNPTIDMKKKLLKEALSKTNAHKKLSASKQTLQKGPQQNQPIQLKKLQTVESIFIAHKQNIIPKIAQKKTPLIYQSQNSSLIDLSNSISLIQSQHESYHSSIFTQKHSCRSSFSQSLYTEQTDDVKSMINKLFEKRNFVTELQQFIGRDVSEKSKEQLQEMKLKLLANEIFVFSLEVRVKEKRAKEKEEIVERQVKKKLAHLIEFSQNQKACHDTEVKLENFLEEKLRKIRRKQF